MKEKLISFLLGVFLGLIICSFYHFFIKTDKNISQNRLGITQNIEMTNERLEEISDRVGISKDELQKELDFGKDIKSIMQEKGVNGRMVGGKQRGKISN